MTAAEQSSLDRLSGQVEAGFREVRGLIEQRRTEDATAHSALNDRLAVVERVAEVNRAFVKFGAYAFTSLIGISAAFVYIVH